MLWQLSNWPITSQPITRTTGGARPRARTAFVERRQLRKVKLDVERVTWGCLKQIVGSENVKNENVKSHSEQSCDKYSSLWKCCSSVVASRQILTGASCRCAAKWCASLLPKATNKSTASHKARALEAIFGGAFFTLFILKQERI